MIQEYAVRPANGPEMMSANQAILAEMNTEARSRPLPINLSSAEIRAMVLELLG